MAALKPPVGGAEPRESGRVWRQGPRKIRESKTFQGSENTKIVSHTGSEGYYPVAADTNALRWGKKLSMPIRFVVEREEIRCLRTSNNIAAPCISLSFRGTGVPGS